MDELIRVLSEQAAKSLNDGCRFQVRDDAFESRDDVRKFINQTTALTGASVRAHHAFGLLVVYSDDGLSEGVSVVMATVER
jgi:hypothetical protein